MEALEMTRHRTWRINPLRLIGRAVVPSLRHFFASGSNSSLKCVGNVKPTLSFRELLFRLSVTLFPDKIPAQVNEARDSIGSGALMRNITSASDGDGDVDATQRLPRNVKSTLPCRERRRCLTSLAFARDENSFDRRFRLRTMTFENCNKIEFTTGNAISVNTEHPRVSRQLPPRHERSRWMRKFRSCDQMARNPLNLM